jgi:peptidylprolyl isomerase
VRRLAPAPRRASVALACLALACVAPAASATPVLAAAAPDRSPLAEVTVTGDVGVKPTVEFSTPLSSAKTLHRQLVAGTGKKLARGDKVTFDYLALDGRTAKELESSFDTSPATITLDPKRSVAGLVKSLVGAKVGSRVLVALGPKEGVAEGLQAQGGDVKKKDTLLFVVDVTGVRAPLAHAEGTPVTPAPGLPTVRVAKNGTPKITVPKAPAPDTLVVQPLVKGTGPEVTAGQTITVNYVGVIWNTGKKFDSSWDRGAPVDFAIGQGQVIAGWDEGLVGQTVGSRVLLVIPPDKGYGSSGQPNAGISGTDTLVFVVEILDAY